MDSELYEPATVLSLALTMSILEVSVYNTSSLSYFCASSRGVTFFTTLAGTPMATLQAGMSFVTTAPAAIVQPCPMVTPGKITVFPPIQQSSPITTGLAYSTLSRLDCTSVSCVAAIIDTLGPNMTVLPIVTRPQSKIVRLKLA